MEAKLTQIIFCDLGVPHKNSADAEKSDGADEKDDSKSSSEREALEEECDFNVYDDIKTKLIAVHDLDIPWRPADLEQRAGRIIRQGNENKNVAIYYYVMKDTFDAYSIRLSKISRNSFHRL